MAYTVYVFCVFAMVYSLASCDDVILADVIQCLPSLLDSTYTIIFTTRYTYIYLDHNDLSNNIRAIS